MISSSTANYAGPSHTMYGRRGARLRQALRGMQIRRGAPIPAAAGSGAPLRSAAGGVSVAGARDAVVACSAHLLQSVRRRRFSRVDCAGCPPLPPPFTPALASPRVAPFCSPRLLPLWNRTSSSWQHERQAQAGAASLLLARG